MTTEIIRGVLRQNGRLGVDVDTLADGDDLYEAGLTSHASVTLMLALEDAFDTEFPEDLLKRSTFASISAIREAVESLSVASATSAMG